MRADHDIDAAVGESLDHLLLLGRGEEPAQELDADRVRREPVGERLRVLAGQQRRRGQNGRLRPVLHRLEDGTHGHLGLPESHVATDQPVHRAGLLHVRLDVGDRLQLVLGLDEAERGLHLGLPRRVRAEGVTLHRQPAAVELNQLLGHLTGCGSRLGPGALPVGSPHFGERRRLPAAVGGDGLDLIDREIEPIAPAVLQDQIVAGGPTHGPRRDPFEAGDPVLTVDHEAPDGQVVEETVGGPGARSRPPVGQAPAGDVGFGEHGDLAIGEDETARQRRRHHEGARRRAALLDDRGVHPFFGQHRRQPRRSRRRGRAERDGVALPDELRHLGRQSARVAGHGAESAHRQRPACPAPPARTERRARRPCSVASRRVEGEVEAGERIVRSVGHPPGQGQRLRQCRLFVEQLDRAITDPPGLDEYHLGARREEVRQEVFLGVDVGQPGLHAVEGLALGQPFPLAGCPTAGCGPVTRRPP